MLPKDPQNWDIIRIYKEMYKESNLDTLKDVLMVNDFIKDHNLRNLNQQ